MQNEKFPDSPTYTYKLAPLSRERERRPDGTTVPVLDSLKAHLWVLSFIGVLRPSSHPQSARTTGLGNEGKGGLTGDKGRKQG